MANTTYYEILEKCTLEAFESLKLKDYYPTDGTKSGWDASSFEVILGSEEIPERIKQVNRQAYIKENMYTTFLVELDRQCKDFEIKYSVTRRYFYKKCYESLLVKISQSSLLNKPDFGIDIDNPCVLTFVWNMRRDIEERSKEIKQTKQVEPELILKEKLISSDVLEMQNNLIPKVSIQEVFNHFEWLTKNTNKKNEFYLTNEQLLIFINSAFVNKKPIKQKFNALPIVKKEVRTIFYNFYKKCQNKETNQTALKEKYFNIMSDSFEGFNDTDRKEFHKVKT